MTTSENRLMEQNHIIPVLLCAIAIPLSMSMWIINLVYSKYLAENQGFDEPLVIAPTRWMASCFIPLLIAVYGVRKKSINFSGAIFGFFVAFVLTLSNYSFLAAIFAFFITSSRATKVRAHLKKKFEAEFIEGGQRNWVQVLCNGGMAAQLSLLYLLDVGASERPIDFTKDYRASWLSIGVLGVFACCNGDTWASELGTVFSDSDPFLISSWKRVPKGTNGGVSVIGTLFSTLGGFVIGLAQYLTVWYFSDRALWAYAPPQWPIIFIGALSGLVGSLIDSLLGATLQYSGWRAQWNAKHCFVIQCCLVLLLFMSGRFGYHQANGLLFSPFIAMRRYLPRWLLTYEGLNKEGKVVNHSSQSVKHISGRSILDNHSVNLISTVIMGLLMPTLSKTIWGMF